MHYVGHFDETALHTPARYEGHSQAYTRFSLVDHRVGSVHMGLNISRLETGGLLVPHIHAYEEGFFILEGEVLGRIDEQVYQFAAGDFGVIPVGRPHAWRNAGLAPVRWLELAAPQPKPAGRERDTFFIKAEAAPEAGAPFDVNDLKGNILGHLEVALDERQVAPTVLQGVHWEVLADHSMGAQHLNLSFSEYHPGVSLSLHDHAFEEAFFVLSGEIEAILDGKPYLVKAGDVFWAGVGCVHAFANVGDVPARWLVVHAPQPPARDAFRFVGEWEERGKAVES